MPSPQGTFNSPNKLPLHYIEKTLTSLMPSEEEILKLDKDELISLARERDRLKGLIERDPVRFFKPTAGAQLNFMTCNEVGKRVMMHIAGNKGGKSTGGAIKLCEILLGRPLWDRSNRTISTTKPPLRGCVLAEDFDSHKETTIPTITTWLPQGEIIKTVKNSMGHVIEHKLKNGSLIHYRTYDQGSDKAEGKDWDIVWFDEPPPRDVYTAVYRGLVAKDGLMLITATLVKEAWIYDERELPAVASFEGSIHDNTWLPAQAKADFLASLDDDERQVREHGKPSSLVGVIYKEFHDAEPFIIEPHSFNVTYPIILGVDPHERRPCYLMYAYINPSDEIIWFRHAFAGGSIPQVFQRLQELDEENGRRPALVIMDPNHGRQIQMNQSSWEIEFINHDYNVELADDDIFLGHKAVRRYLSYNSDNPPMMRFFNNLRGKGGPIAQMLRYSWEDWSRQTRGQKSLKEKPKDSNKDFPDIIRYTAISDLQFDILHTGHKTIECAKMKDRNERFINAY